MIEKVLHLTDKLVALKTLSLDKGACSAALEYILTRWNGHHQWYECGDGHDSLLLHTQDSKEIDLLFITHIDVVPGPEHMFTTSMSKDREWLLGRGTADMKAYIAAVFHLMEKWKEEGRNINAAMLITSDEEIGSPHCADHVLGEMLNSGFQIRYAIVPDGGGDIHYPVMEQKACMQIQIVTQGKTAHASRPHQGRNAAEILLEVIENVTNRLDDELDNGPNVSGEWGTTFCLTKLNAGNQGNQIPDQASALFDIRMGAPARIVDERSKKEAIQKIKEHILEIFLDSCEGHYTSSQVVAKAESFFADPKEEMTVLLASVIQNTSDFVTWRKLDQVMPAS